MKRNYQLLATDMDGTLLNKSKQITEATKEMIAEATNAGKHLAICTGRGLHEALPFLEGIDGIAYVVASNGAYIYDRSTKTVLQKRSIQKEAMDFVMDYISSKDILFYGNVDGGSLTDEARICRMEEYYAHQYAKLFMKIGQRVDNISTHYKKNPDLEFYKINLFHRSGEKRNETFEMLEKADISASYCFGDESNIEMSPQGVDKGWALDQLCKRLNVSSQDVIYVGDDWNDASAMEYAGLPIAMGNASKEIKSICKDETADCNQDGVGKIIEKYLL